MAELGEKKTKFKVGEKVRLAVKKDQFEKSYVINWSDRIYTIKQVLTTRPITYIVENDKGEVHNVQVKSGIGYGCDQEAKRIVKLLKYPSQINKGVRINTKFKIAIHFNLPKARPIQIKYVYTKKS